MALTEDQGRSMVREAELEALAAAAGVVPTPIAVVEVEPFTNVPRGEPGVILEGECGSAWVNVKPANGTIARAIAAHGSPLSRPHRDTVLGGLTVQPGREWSHARNLAAAEAYAGAIERWASRTGETVRVRVDDGLG